jgi:uracil-DNA glycosylase family 4
MSAASGTFERAARLVRQHAETARLLGVDFVPVFRTGAAVVSAAPEAPAPDLPAAPAAEPETVPTPRVEAPPVVVTASAPPPIPAGGLSREEAQRRLDELRERYERDAPHKKFVTAHTKIVFGEGDPRARLMFIGEAPGADEDRTGRPFVGRAGQLLDKMIVAMGLKREQVYIANVLKTRPPNNATPTKEEAALCAPYLFEQIAIVSPEVIVTLGLPATRTILSTEETMTRLRGKWGSFTPPLGLAPGAEPIPVMPTYHPAFLLRSYTPDNRAKVWSDLQKVMDRLGLRPPAKGAENP